MILNLAVMPAFAGKPVGNGHISLAAGNDYLQFNVFNDGDIAIAGVEVKITVGGPIPSGNFYGVAGWSVLRGTDYALYETTGRTVIRRGQSGACGAFNCNPADSYTVTWTIYDRKGNPISNGVIDWN